MKKKLLLLCAGLMLLFSYAAARAADGAADTATEENNAISRVRLTTSSVPPGMEIAQQVWASAEELLRIRLKVGFALDALLNQSIIYGQEEAKVNYILPRSQEWLSYGYSRLIETDGDKSVVFTKDNVIVQVAATSEGLEDEIVYLLKADLIYRLKIRKKHLPEDWTLVDEHIMSHDDLSEIDRAAKCEIKFALAQALVCGRSSLDARYYDCGDMGAAERLGNYLANRTNPIYKRQVLGSGPIIIVVESQSDEAIRRAVELISR